jgi:hypothetical protein
MKLKMIVTLFVLTAMAVVAAEKAKPTGPVKFSVETKRTKGKYAPKHVLAIWVTNAKGKFVRTLEVYGKKRRKYLKVWAKNSKKNTVDAITGATLKKHVPHNVVWDCRDAKGKLVPDGTYHIHVEFSEANRKGPMMPLRHVKFRKGAKAISIKPKDTPNFVKITLDYTPEKKEK